MLELSLDTRSVTTTSAVSAPQTSGVKLSTKVVVSPASMVAPLESRDQLPAASPARTSSASAVPGPTLVT